MSGVYQCMYIHQMNTHQSTVQYKKSVFINYVSEHQLSHAVSAFHTTPTTHVNWDAMVYETDWWRCCLCFKWVSYISEIMT